MVAKLIIQEQPILEVAEKEPPENKISTVSWLRYTIRKSKSQEKRASCIKLAFVIVNLGDNAAYRSSWIMTRHPIFIWCKHNTTNPKFVEKNLLFNLNCNRFYPLSHTHIFWLTLYDAKNCTAQVQPNPFFQPKYGLNLDEKFFAGYSTSTNSAHNKRDGWASLEIGA